MDVEYTGCICVRREFACGRDLIRLATLGTFPIGEGSFVFSIHKPDSIHIHPLFQKQQHNHQRIVVADGSLHVSLAFLPRERLYPA